MTQHIRKATTDDVGTITILIRTAFAEHDARLDPPSSVQRMTEATVYEDLANGSAFVYEEDGVIVGCVITRPYEDHLYLGRLSVQASFRRQGIARALMHAVEGEARRLGLPRIRLSVRLALAEHRAYYERAGYHFYSYGTHPGYAAPTYVTLEKDVHPDNVTE